MRLGIRLLVEMQRNGARKGMRFMPVGKRIRLRGADGSARMCVDAWPIGRSGAKK